MSERQLAFINRLCEEKGVSLEEATRAAMGRRQSKLGKKGASKVIDHLMGLEAPSVETAQEASAAIDRLKAQQPRRSNGGGSRRRRRSRWCECGASDDLLSVGYRPGDQIRCHECGGIAEAC